MILILIFLTIFLGRLNSSLLGYEFLNTDEFAIGAKGIRIIKDNFNFHEFDGDTSGILNVLFLIWPDFFGFDITYLSIRLSAILILSLILFYVFKSISLFNDSKSSFIFLLPILLFFSLTKDPDFLHYTNELVACLLITFSIYHFLKSREKDLSREKNLLKDTLLTSVPAGSVLFAKMQFYPLASVLIVILILNEFFKKKNFKVSLFYIFGFILPLVIISIYYFFYKEFLDLFYNVIHYPLSDLVARNLDSEKIIADTNNLIAITNSNKKEILINHLLYNSVFHYFYLYLLVFITTLFFFKKTNILNLISFELFTISLLILFSLIISISTGSVHRHYLIITMPLIPIFLAIFFRDLKLTNSLVKKRIKFPIIIFLIFFSISLMFENKKFYSSKFIHTKAALSEFKFFSPNLFQHFKLQKESKIIIWGWKPEFYLLSNFSPATRETINQKQIDFKSNREYFRGRFLKDFKNNKPNLVIDYVKPRSHMFTNEKNNIKSFPELYKNILKNYIKLKNNDLNCPEIYLQKDSFKYFDSRLVKFYFDKKMSEFDRINDLQIDEDLCDTSVMFNNKHPNKLGLKIKNENLKEILVLASKKNRVKINFDLKILYKDGKIEEKTAKLNKYPFWSKINLDDNKKISKLEFDISKLKGNSLGIAEIIIFR